MITIRTVEESDINFIYATMLNALYYGCPLYHEIEKEAFFKHYQGVVHGLLLKGSTSPVVACLTDEPDVLLGFAITEPGALHFVYVKQSFRKQGIARMLLSGCSEFSSVTHITELGNIIRKAKGWVYNPFLI